MNFVVRVLVTALALWLTSLIVPNHVDIVDNGTSGGTVLAALVIALVFNLVHLVIKPVVALLSLPLYILTLGLFTLVVNALMLWITTRIADMSWWGDQPHWGLDISGGFWWYVLAALIISVLQLIIGAFAPKRK